MLSLLEWMAELLSRQSPAVLFPAHSRVVNITMYVHGIGGFLAHIVRKVKMKVSLRKLFFWIAQSGGGGTIKFCLHPLEVNTIM